MLLFFNISSAYLSVKVSNLSLGYPNTSLAGCISICRRIEVNWWKTDGQAGLWAPDGREVHLTGEARRDRRCLHLREAICRNYEGHESENDGDVIGQTEGRPPKKKVVATTYGSVAVPHSRGFKSGLGPFRISPLCQEKILLAGTAMPYCPLPLSCHRFKVEILI